MRRKRPPFERSRDRLFTSLFLVAVFLVIGSVLLFNRNGFVAISEMQTKLHAVSMYNESLKTEIDSLSAVIYLLQTDSLYMEKRTREILGWGRENEMIIKFWEPESD